MKSMDKGLTIPKWPKIPQMAQNLSPQFVYPSLKVWDLDEKKASLGVRSPCMYIRIKILMATVNGLVILGAKALRIKKPHTFIHQTINGSRILYLMHSRI